MQKETQNNLYTLLSDVVPKNVLTTKNKARSWEYGLSEKYDIIVISKDGTLGDVVSIQGLRIGLPATPKDCFKRDKSSPKQ